MKLLLFILLLIPLTTFCQWSQIGQTLIGDNQSDQFGFSVALDSSGNRVVIGAPGGDYVRVFDKVGSSWQQVGQTISDSTLSFWSKFGHSVAITSNGDFIIVGAQTDNDPNDPTYTNHGSATVFQFILGTWVQRGRKLYGERCSGNGTNVSISSNGDKILTNGNNMCGSSTYFTGMFVWDSLISDWSQPHWNVSGYNSGSSKLSANGLKISLGSGYVGLAGGIRNLRYDIPNDIWHDNTYINTDSLSTWFGYSVDLTDNGNTLIIGAPLHYTNLFENGKIKVYSFDSTNSSWNQFGNQILGDTNYIRFGHSVSISGDGNVIAACNDGSQFLQGYAEILSWNGVIWQSEFKYQGSRLCGAVDLNYAGNRAVVGSPYGSVNNKGEVSIFKRGSIAGYVFQDFNQNCLNESNEIGFPYLSLSIAPGDLIVNTNQSGGYIIDSLPAGTYTITADTTNPNWIPTCPTTQTFTVVHPDSLTQGPDFGFISAYPCNQPNVSIIMPQMRRGFTNPIYIQACNENTATNIMDSAYCVVELPNGLIFQSASLAHTALGNNQYSFYLDTIYPGQCVNFTIQATVSLSNSAGSTLCLEAQLYPQDSCVFDTTTYTPYTPSPSGTVSPCTLPWDRSSLMVEGECIGDSVRFVIYNTGDPIDGDMDCFAPVRVYVDGQFYLLDSIQLAGGDSIVFMFEGNGSTWILQADQHPLHPGNSHPNAHVENCGTGTGNGTGVVIQFPSDDADPVIDIYCGQVTAPVDPNDKTGFPGGLTSMHYIQQNQKLEYLIRFQNVGTDTAVNVVIRDTLSTDLNIFTVVPEVASHDYTFKMYGSRILEWTFNNIMLPDSNVNEPASNGFVKFRVDQVPDLPYGTVIENSAAIYFDFEAPVITKTYFHTIHDFSIDVSVDKTQSVDGFEAVLIPNPVSDYATLHLSGLKDYNNINIQLFDMTGRQVHAMNNQSTDKIPLKVNNLTKGVYVVQVVQGGRSVGVLKMVVR